MSSDSKYDHRRGARYEDSERHREDHRPRESSRRERSRSPAHHEEERRARMARLRAENEKEERQITEAMEQKLEEVKPAKGPRDAIVEVNPEELEGLDEEEQMKALLGFGGGFGSTKGEKVEDNHVSSARGAAAKHKARKYRQYMNRKNGFNRPLEKMN